eukprot:TRINITY_DN13066_c0_g1_i4.p2 TRINITY_DN13066_c0_g1~~TRINITY_DN13066_c0_g1_i4.p2  ORF type:complete len:288 (-),score=50.65 TRINITY_DN13066_c0_g1_i4:41-904(-)
MLRSLVGSEMCIRDRAIITEPGPKRVARMSKVHELGDGSRVKVWNSRLKRKLAGTAAPLRRNLEGYLQSHPDCELYHGQDIPAVKDDGDTTGPAIITEPGPKRVARMSKVHELGDGSRVKVWNSRLKRKLAGTAAPLRRNLEGYLQSHPDCELYHGQDIPAVKDKPPEPDPTTAQPAQPAQPAQIDLDEWRSTTTSSGYQGVYRHKHSGKWQAGTSGGRTGLLGLFETPEEAALVFASAFRWIHSHPNPSAPTGGRARENSPPLSPRKAAVPLTLTRRRYGDDHPKD